jgi:hypothetical protein
LLYPDFEALQLFEVLISLDRLSDGFGSLGFQLSLQLLLLASPPPVSYEFPYVVGRLNCLSGFIADSDALMRIKLPHSLADVAADRIHEFAINTVFKHARNGMVAQIVGPQLVEAGDIAQMVP